jgi:hypothetical protein
MSRKIDRALHGPSWVEVIFGAVLSLVLGVIVGAALLILRPVLVVKQMPKEDAIDPTAVYFVEGTRETSKARDAVAKRKAFAEGQSVSVIEDELNALAGPAATFAAPKAGEPAGAPAATAASDQMMATGTPNFRLRDGALQIGAPVTISLLGLSEKVVVQARGGFEKQDGVFVYEPDVFYVGSLPVQRLPLLANYARAHFLNAQLVPDDVKAAWTKLASVSIDGNVLNLKMP